MTERDRQIIEETGGVYPTNNGVGDEGIVIGIFAMIIVFFLIITIGLFCK